MKKKLIALFIMVVMVLASVVGLVACDPTEEETTVTDISVWVSELAGVKTLTENQINAFFDANPDYKGKYNVSVEGVGEGEAATNMITDVASGADIFCFAQDQLGRLVEANALSKLGVQAKAGVSENNDASSIAAVSLSGEMYAYPITSDNGYFLYYDNRVFTEDDVKDLAKIVEKAEAAEMNVSFELGGSAWYTASFFFGAGCHSTWTYNNEAKTWSYNDDFNSDKGIIAMKGMNILTGSDKWMDSSSTGDFASATPSCAVVSGTWGLAAAKLALSDKVTGTGDEAVGDGKFMGVAKLPSFTVDGQTYQLGSYSGNKLMGVKPHTDANVQAFCHALAQYLSNKDAQLARFDQFGWGPSNLDAQKEDRVQADATLAALAAQNEFAIPQGQIAGGWWDFAKQLGAKSAKGDSYVGDNNKPVTNAFQAALDDYTKAMENFASMSDDDRQAFGVVGKIASLAGVKENLAVNQTTWSDWNTDLVMVLADDGVTYTSKVAVVLAAGDEFQCRQGQAWDVQFGAIDEATGNSTKNNYVITADNAGKYFIKLVVTKNDKGEIVSGIVSLVEAE